MPTIFRSVGLTCLFIKHFADKVAKPRANIASKHVTSTFVTGTAAANFYLFGKVSQITEKECILNCASMSCELDLIPSKLLVECIDSILPSFTDLFNYSLASGILTQCVKSALLAHSTKQVS